MGEDLDNVNYVGAAVSTAIFASLPILPAFIVVLVLFTLCLSSHGLSIPLSP